MGSGRGTCDSSKDCGSTCGSPTSCSDVKQFTGVGGCAATCCSTNKRVKKWNKKYCDEAAVATTCGSGGWIDACCTACGGEMTGLCTQMLQHGFECPDSDPRRAGDCDETKE